MRKTLLTVLMAAVLLALPAMGAATISIINNDGAGVGLNDPTVVPQVGTNPHTTLGAQRLYALQHAVGVWAAKLDSSVTIVVRASFEPLTCTATAAVLGSAGAIEVFRDFSGALFAGTWYPGALADKLFGSSISPGSDDIRARFNRDLGGRTACPAVPFTWGRTTVYRRVRWILWR